jgi:hypothetical protein
MGHGDAYAPAQYWIIDSAIEVEDRRRGAVLRRNVVRVLSDKTSTAAIECWPRAALRIVPQAVHFPETV